jgi:hypothetical protein
MEQSAAYNAGEGFGFILALLLVYGGIIPLALLYRAGSREIAMIAARCDGPCGSQ